MSELLKAQLGSLRGRTASRLQPAPAIDHAKIEENRKVLALKAEESWHINQLEVALFKAKTGQFGERAVLLMGSGAYIEAVGFHYRDLEPAKDYTDILGGLMALCGDVEIRSDAYLHPEKRCIPLNEIRLVRRPVQS